MRFAPSLTSRVAHVEWRIVVRLIFLLGFFQFLDGGAIPAVRAESHAQSIQLPTATSNADRCRDLAGYRYEPGVESGTYLIAEIDIALAEPACRAAVSEDPSAPNLFRLGRVLVAMEKYRDAYAALRRAADGGYAPAMTSLGFMFMDDQVSGLEYVSRLEEVAPGLKCKVDRGKYAVAFKQFFDGAQGGDPKAAAWLAWMYIDGYAVSYFPSCGNDPRDYPSALRFARTAAARDDPFGQYFMGVLHQHGHAVRMDVAEALTWYRLAEAQGVAEAEDRISEIERGGSATRPSCGQTYGISPSQMPCGSRYRPIGSWEAKYWCYTDFRFDSRGATWCTDGMITRPRNGFLDPCDGTEGWCRGGVLE